MSQLKRESEQMRTVTERKRERETSRQSLGQSVSSDPSLSSALPWEQRERNLVQTSSLTYRSVYIHLAEEKTT